MNRAEVNIVMRRVAAALLLSSAPFVAAERAYAICDPPAPANNTTVNCTGTTQDQNPGTPAGYGTGTETNATINVGTAQDPTATVIGTLSNGILVHDATVNNFGTVTGFSSGIEVDAVLIAGVVEPGRVTVNNSGTIQGTNNVGIVGRSGSMVTVTNTVSGAIIGAFTGISGDTVNVTNDGGFIASSATGTGIVALSNGTVVNKTNGIGVGTILGGAFGIDASGNTGDPPANVTVTNGDAATPGGLIVSGAGGTAIHATGTATILSNVGDGITTGIIKGDKFGIDAGTVNVIANSGAITSFGGGTAIHATGNANVTNIVNGTSIGTISGGAFAIDAANVTVTNGDAATPGGIIASGAGGTAIHATGTATILSNVGDGITTGIIRGDAFGIDAGKVIIDANTGLIEAIRAVNSTAVNSASDVTIKSNSGRIRTDDLATSGVAVEAVGTADITSSGTIEANGTRGVAIDASSVKLNNSGVVQANGSNGVGIFANSTGDIHNFGKILATGASGIAIFAANPGSTATITNVGDGIATGIISADQFGVDAATVTVTGNSGLIEATGANGIIHVAIEATDATVTGNTGTIRANGTGPAAAIEATNITITGNAGTIEATGAGNTAVVASATATVDNVIGGAITGGKFGIQATTLDVANAFGATISGGTAGVTGAGTVRTAGTISGGTGAGQGSVVFSGGAGIINQLFLQTGAVLNGDALGSTAGATNNLILQGSGATTSNFVSFNNLNVQASGGTWLWNSTTSAFGQTTVESGTLAVDGVLFSPVGVSSGAVLGGRGTINGVVSVAGTLAPGAAVPFSTLTVNGNVNFANASIYRVNVGAANQNDKLQLNASGTASLGNATVNVLAQSGFALATPYNILNASGGLNNTRFGSATSNLAFLTPTLTYDPNNVFLTLDATNGGGGGGGGGGANFGFASAAQTPNQRAVAGALDASSATNSLVLAVLGQTLDGARRAFDALSGEIFGSVQTTQADQAQFTRSTILSRLRQASYAGVDSELGALGFAGPEMAYAPGEANAAYAADVAVPAKAPARSPLHAGERSRDLTFWAQGLGGWGHADSDGNAASLRSRFAGFLSGVDARFGDMVRAGFTAGYIRSDLNADARASSAGIDSVQIGAYAGGKLGALNVRGGASYSFDSIDVSRGIFFPGFTDQTKASFRGNVGQVFGEVGYGMTLGSVAVEPLAGLAYVHVHDNSFAESGGAAALSGASARENLGYSFLGARAATVIPLANGTALVPRASVQWQYAFGDVTPVSALAFQGTGTGFSVAGVPIARNTALVEAGFDWRFSPWAKLGAFYQGELAAHAQTHAVKGGLTWNF
jgi:outer membrane autotransporter protein